MEISDIVTVLVRDLEYDGHEIEYGNSSHNGAEICIDGTWVLIRTM
jgi:hypothetical protein